MENQNPTTPATPTVSPLNPPKEPSPAPLAAAGLTPEQEKLLANLQAIKGATAAIRCGNCGSPLHKSC